MKIRVMVADDHGMVRKGIVAYLKNNPDLEIVGEAENGRDAVELAQKLAPDVILMDLQMPELDGIAATRLIQTTSAHARHRADEFSRTRECARRVASRRDQLSDQKCFRRRPCRRDSRRVCRTRDARA